MPIYKFGSPELTGHDGNPIEVPSPLADRLRRHALEAHPVGESLFNELDPKLSTRLAACSLQIAAEPIEKAIVLSADGEPLGSKLGRRSNVSIDLRLLGNAHLIHNHPEGTPLSHADVKALFETELASVWAVGGTWLYGASIGRKGKNGSVAADFKVTYSHLSDATFAVVSDLFRHNPGIEPESLESRHLHAVLCELAEAGFIHYCRVRYGA